MPSTYPIQIKRYTAGDLDPWNTFVDAAKNGTFLFKREYVDYHQHRFADHSLLIYADNELSALFICNEVDDRIESHGGLTYGGLILENTVRLERVLQFFYHIARYYNAKGFKSILYKCLPSYLASYPSNEELYALFLLNAGLVRRDTSMVLARTSPLPKQQRVTRSLKISESNNYEIATSTHPQKFWAEILIPNLKERFGVDPVHSASEMDLLMQRFPDNIHLFEVYKDELIAGGVVYVTPTVAHLQYISSNATGRQGEAPGALVHHLVDHVYADKRYFSFGTSNAGEGSKLNRGLASWKEGFGARTFVHDFYEIQTGNFTLLKDYE